MQITKTEIDLYNILLDEVGMEAEDLVIRKLGAERAAHLLIAVHEDMEQFFDQA